MYMVSVFLLFLYTFFIELSALIDKIKKYAHDCGYFLHSWMGDKLTGKKGKIYE